MTRREQEISTYETTIGEMLRMAREHKADCKPYAGKSVFEFYDYVRRLPYHDDPEGVEHMSRPRYTLNQNWTGPRDCDDKTLCLAAYCELHSIPYRIVVCGERETPHHVYPEIKLGSGYVPADATYSDRCSLGVRLYQEQFRKEFYPQ